MKYTLSSKYIYADSAGFTLLNKFVHFSSGMIIPTPNRSSANQGDILISDFKLAISKIFNASDYEIILGYSNTDISNKLALSCTLNWQTCIASPLEHHSSYVPWMNQSNLNNKLFSFGTMQDDQIIFENKADIFLINYISNISGKNNHIDIQKLRQSFPSSLIIVDGAQCFGNIPNLNQSSYDIFYFSSQKCTLIEGISVCFIKRNIIHLFPPVNLGGGNIMNTINNNIVFQKNYESGTPSLRSIYSMFNNLNVFKYKDTMRFEKYMVELAKICKWKLIHQNCKRTKSIYSFDTYPIHPHDISEFLLTNNIITRAGNLCCSKFFETNNPVLRLSFGPKNTIKQIIKICQLIITYTQKYNKFISII